MNIYEQTKKEVIEILCRNFKITRNQMFSKKRKRPYTDARFMLALWIKQNTKHSLKEIGTETRDIPYDHTSILHSIAEAKNLISQDVMYESLFNGLPQLENIKIYPKLISLQFRNNNKLLS